MMPTCHVFQETGRASWPMFLAERLQWYQDRYAAAPYAIYIPANAALPMLAYQGIPLLETRDLHIRYRDSRILSLQIGLPVPDLAALPARYGQKEFPL